MDLEEFQIIEEKKIILNEEVEAPLPDWIKYPNYFSNDPAEHSINIETIYKLDPIIKDNLIKRGITRLFPVQFALITALLNLSKLCLFDPLRPKDICVKAPTGSGKTLAYVLPILQTLNNQKRYNIRNIQAVIILPTKNLASQVYNVFNQYSENLNIKVGLISGEKNIDIEREEIMTSSSFRVNELCLEYYDQDQLPLPKVDVIVATPGRLIDHIHNTSGFKLNNLKFLVVDEADRVFHDVKQDWLFHLNRSISLSSDNDSNLPYWAEGQPMSLASQVSGIFRRPPQKLLLSATFSFDPDKLAQLNLFLPLMLEGRAPSKEFSSAPCQDVQTLECPKVQKYVLPSTLEQRYLECPRKGDKPLYLLHLLASNRFSHVLCFTKSVESSHRLAQLLNFTGAFPLNPVAELSSRQKGSKGRAIIQRFTLPNTPSSRAPSILVCSDIMARGMDIKFDVGTSFGHSGLTVINYDCPMHAKSYVHRVGRTARAGRRGFALTFVESEQLPALKDMFSGVGWNFDRDCPRLDFTGEEMGEVESLVPKYRRALLLLKRETETKANTNSTHKRRKEKRKMTITK